MTRTAPRPFYTEYAWAYDLLIERPVARHGAFMAEEFCRLGILPGAKILDAGCGTGRYSLELARRGYAITGLDASPFFIGEAERQTRRTSLPVAFTSGDMLAWCAPEPYDGILCRGVLNDLVDETSRQEVFFAFARALRPDGVLIFDVREWDATVRRKVHEPVFEKTVDTPRGRLTFHSVTRLDHPQKRLLIAERQTLAHDGGESVSTYNFVMRCWTPEELQHHLGQAGFRNTVYFGDYDRTVLAGSTDRLIGVASRL
jgi:SAM-dependent methyltransferase